MLLGHGRGGGGRGKEAVGLNALCATGHVWPPCNAAHADSALASQSLGVLCAEPSHMGQVFAALTVHLLSHFSGPMEGDSSPGPAAWPRGGGRQGVQRVYPPRFWGKPKGPKRPITTRRVWRGGCWPSIHARSNWMVAGKSWRLLDGCCQLLEACHCQSHAAQINSLT